MNPYKILLVEDDAEISEMLKTYLETENYEVACALDGQHACAMFDEGSFDLVLLDLMIPKVSGMGVMQHIRAGSFVPIIILSAKDSESDKTLGLGLGADDYITKPFSLAVLRARVALQLRRVTESKTQSSSAEMIIGEYRFDFLHMKFYRGAEQVELSKTEQRLLHILVENRGLTVPRDRLFEYIWSEGEEFVEENALSVTVKRLRDKLDAQETIKTVYGIGYTWAMQ